MGTRNGIAKLSPLVAVVVVTALLTPSGSTVAADAGFTVEGPGQGARVCRSGAKIIAPASPGPEFVPDQLLVRFQPSAAAGRADQILAERGLSRIRRIKALDVHVLRLPPGLSVEQAVETFNRLPEVAFAEPNYILYAAQAPAEEIVDQWALSRVQALEAWSYISDTLGGDPEPPLLATVDTGVDQFHPDLAANIWRNPGEITGTVGFDDDENEYVDDIWGWDFVNNDNDPFDDNMHGTAVSSVAAAVRDGSGMAGLCPWCQVVAVKVLAANGSGSLDVVAQEVVYATDIGARVVNLSMVATMGSQSLEDAVNYAWDHGTLVVTAAGNHGTEELRWPAAYDNAMSIASSNNQDCRSCFSGYSEGYISVAAPGEAILCATPDGNYGTYSGTSLSAPYVTGLAGLVLSLDPTSTVTDVRNTIETTTEDLGPVGSDAFYGTGRINAYRAVTGNVITTTPPYAGGLVSDDRSASGYAHARKLARDVTGTLHLVWHGEDGGQYRVLYAASSDDGGTWDGPQVVFSSSAETYHPALALDESYVYVAFPSLHGSSSYGTLFTRKPLSGTTWPTPTLVMGGSYDAVRPDLYLDPSNGRLHLVASSFDNAPYAYYAQSDDGGVTWTDPVQQVNLGQNSRYADVHAYGPHVYIAARTVYLWPPWFPLIRYFWLHTTYSLDNGASWDTPTELAYHAPGIFDAHGEYGISLAGFGDRLYLGYEHQGNILVRSSTTLTGTEWSEPESLGAGRWPSIAQASNGHAWAMWESNSNLFLRHYTGASWELTETLTSGGYYPNLKLGTSGDWVEWVVARCDAPYRLASDGRDLGPTAVALASFEVAPLGDGMLLTWETATELDSLGFNLYRATSAGGPRTQLNDGLIPVQAAGSPAGATYRFLDGLLARGVSYYYWLEDVDVHGGANLHGPVAATIPHRLFLPLIVLRR